MANSPDLSLVIACYEEAEALPHLFGEIDRLGLRAEERGLDLEVVMVDDGSRDDTSTLIETWCQESTGRRALRHAKNRGFGAAMRTGFGVARGRVVVCYDADATYPVLDVLTLHDALESADVAAASPFAGDAGSGAAAGVIRTCISRAAAALYRLALRDRARGLTVFTCAFRAYRAEALRGLSWRADDFLAAAEVLSRLLLAGRRIREVPSRLTRRRHGRSKMRFARTSFRHLGLLGRIALRIGGFRSRVHGRSRRRRAPAAPVITDLPRWNRELNEAWPMRRIEGHGCRFVRGVEERRRRKVVMLAAPRRGQVVLDVGAEEGAYAARLRARGARPVSLDIDHAVLKRSRARGAPCVAGDAHALPLRDRSVQRVILAEVLEHCPDPAGALAEALRVVSASGRVALSVPDDLPIIWLKGLIGLLGLSRLLGGLPPGRAPGHLHVFGRETLRRLLSSSGRLLSLTRDARALAFLAVVAPRPEGE